MRATAVVVLARVVVFQLSERMINVNVIRSVRRVSQHFHVLSRVLVGSHDGFQVPVRPVEPIVHDAEGEDVRYLAMSQHGVLVLAVEVGVSDVVQMSVGPPDLFREKVDGESVGPSQIIATHGGHDSLESVVSIAVHSDAANVSIQVPRSKENVSLSRMHHQGASVFDAGHDGFPVSAVQLGYVHVLRVSVQPIQFRVDPIDGNAF